MKNPKFIVILVIAITGLSCNYTRLILPQPTATVAPLITELSQTTIPQNLDGAVATAIAQGQKTGRFDLVLTETEINTYIALQLQSQTDFNIENPQVMLTPGQISVSGDVIQSGIKLPLDATFSTTVDGNGNLQVTVIKATVGSFPLPENIRDEIASQIDQNIKSQVASDSNQVYFDAVTIETGKIEIRAHIP